MSDLFSFVLKHTSDAPTVFKYRAPLVTYCERNMTKPKTLFLYFVYILFLSEGLMYIDVHVLHIIMSKKLENYHDWSG